MDKEQIARINALAHKAKNKGLTEQEKREQRLLRAEYVAAVKASLIRELEHTYIQSPDGRRIKIEKKM